MEERKRGSERVVAFADGVFAILITLLVLDLHAPHLGTLQSLWALWPSFVGYGVSYLFLAIVWINHHHLLRLAPAATPQLIWSNFGHLFSVSLVPFTTSWIANTHLAPIPMAAYALVFVLVNVTYLMLCMEVVDRQHAENVPYPARRSMRRRSLLTLGAFISASIVALVYPIGSLAIVCACLILYLRPEAPSKESIEDPKEKPASSK
ncbi:TMEM175 family protein [Dyella humicola]|uniref:TMEM175 family protein n=1 Tax=Dyella humicola TaxID=2992126 RepID=UPI0022567EF6|nr:TMEM175 family protein [Dyella humicola]